MTASRRIFHGAVFILLLREADVLLLRRANTGYRDGQYTLPAGHLDGNETAITAAIRETREEVGVSIAPEDARVVAVVHRGPEADGDVEYVDFYVAASRWDGEPANTEPEKCDGIVWASLDQLPAETIPYVVEAITHVRAGIWFSTYGIPA